MFSHYSTKALILGEREVSEADKSFTVFSEDFGLMEVMGRSIRKIDSKLKGAMIPLTLSSIEFIQGRHYKILIYSEEEESFERIRENLFRLKVAYKMSDFLRKLVGEEKKDPRLWSLIVTTFKEIERSPSSIAPLYLTYLYFLWKLLSHFGYKPELYNCVSCGKRVEPGEPLFSEGGVSCRECGEGVETDERVLEILRKIEKSSLQEFRRSQLRRGDIEKLERLVEGIVVNI